MDWGLALRNVGPIIVVDRFAPLRTQFLSLLSDLDDDNWTAPTAAPGWCVKDVVAHLLGGILVACVLVSVLAMAPMALLAWHRLKTQELES